MTYNQNPFTASYIANSAIGSGQREDQVDHAWHNILTEYFPAPLYSIERESYIVRNSRRAANAAVVNNRAGIFHRVVIFEAKRPPPEVVPGSREWAEILDELRGNMQTIRAAEANPPVQTLYGIAAIGPFVRMYAMSQHDPNGRLTIVATGTPANTLHVDIDDGMIEQILQQIEFLIRTNRNDY